jgi:hypothetical protein
LKNCRTQNLNYALFQEIGALVKVTGAKLVPECCSKIIFVAKKEHVDMFLTASGVLIKKNSKNAIGTIVHNALPIRHSDFEKVLVDENYFKQLNFTMFQVLTNKDIP